MHGPHQRARRYRKEREEEKASRRKGRLMPRRMSEYLFLFDSGKTSGDVMAAVNGLHAVFEKYGAEILASRPWADQRLAYPIRHQKKGLYYLIYCRCDTDKVHEIEGDL